MENMAPLMGPPISRTRAPPPPLREVSRNLRRTCSSTFEYHLSIVKAFTTGLCEDEDEDLYFMRSTDPDDSNSASSSTSFSSHGFEAGTVELVLGTPPTLSHKRVSALCPSLFVSTEIPSD